MNTPKDIFNKYCISWDDIHKDENKTAYTLMLRDELDFLKELNEIKYIPEFESRCEMFVTYLLKY